MGESLLLLTLLTIVILAIRRSKPVVLATPLVIERPGQYHITFAPQINQAQTFVEAIARNFSESGSTDGDLPVQYFKVHDAKVAARNESFYLLAVALREGMLYIQAINTTASDELGHLRTVREFSEMVLQRHPIVNPSDEASMMKLTAAVESAAAQLNIVVQFLHEAG